MKKIRWSRKLAYAVGLITTDGSLSKDSRHIALVSKDIEQLRSFSKILQLKNKISPHISTYKPNNEYFHIQFGNVRLYRFLLKIGLTPNKSKTLGALNIPQEYFIDFLRGHLDGDGNISLVKHPESQFLQLRTRLCSASLVHLIWLKDSVKTNLRIEGGFISKLSRDTYYLTYSKRDSLKLLDLMYYKGVKYYLKRKFIYLNQLGEWRNRYTR